MEAFIKRILILIFLSCMMGMILWVSHPKVPAYQQGKLAEGGILLSGISQNEAVLWLDARTEEEYRSGHIPGAILLNLENFDALVDIVLEAYDPDKLTIVYCSEEKCQSSRKISGILLQEFELENVYFLEGGWEAWRDSQK